jgi:Alpha-2-macroglobulin bait region domain
MTRFYSQINIDLSKEQVKPGEIVNISVGTKPNSFVGLLGVDQSVLVLKSGNDIEKSTVFEELEKYNRIDQHNHINTNCEDMNFRDFASSDSVIITNARHDFGEFSFCLLEISFKNMFCTGLDNNPTCNCMMQYSRFYSRRAGGGSSGSPIMFANMRSQERGGTEITMLMSMSQPKRMAADIVQCDSFMETDQQQTESAKLQKPIEIRTEFPETWLFESFDLDCKYVLK